MPALFKTPWHSGERNSVKTGIRHAVPKEPRPKSSQEVEWLGWDGWVDTSSPTLMARSLTNT